MTHETLTSWAPGDGGKPCDCDGAKYLHRHDLYEDLSTVPTPTPTPQHSQEPERTTARDDVNVLADWISSHAFQDGTVQYGLDICDKLGQDVDTLTRELAEAKATHPSGAGVKVSCEQFNKDVAATHESYRHLVASLTRERDEAREALRVRSKAYHQHEHRDKATHPIESPHWTECQYKPCVSDRALLKEQR